MIDPMLALAFSVHHNKGAYALLLGSGVSRAAGITTGWEVVIDLIQKVARLQGEDCDPDPAAWYKAKYNEEPDYSKLLDQLAPAPSERNRLLQTYFEPTEEEREQNLKVPTEAHKAIAELVAAGYIRVIITTNFDRLLERTLEAVSITPTVISTPDAVEGALPLQHTACTIVKVHGDYMDTRIKNTPDELAAYDTRFDRILDRVFDEYGLIICGWSADWDVALGAALQRCHTHRFTTYWAARGAVSGKAQQLVQLRRAQLIPIQGADPFFRELSEKVLALDEYEQPHPLSATLAIVSVKKYIVDDRFRIQLHDMVMQESNKLHSTLAGTLFSMTTNSVSHDELVRRVTQYRALTEPLLSMLITGCYWGEQQHTGLWTKCLTHLVNLPHPSPFMDVWVNLRQYPSLLLLYGAGIAALAGEKHSTVAGLLTQVQVRDPYGRGNQPIVLELTPNDVMEQRVGNLFHGEKHNLFVPVSEHLFTVLREPLRELIPQDQQYDESFDRFEYIFGLVYADLRQSGNGLSNVWGPRGRFGWKRHRSPGIHISNKLDAEVTAAGANWGPLKAGLFSGSLDRFQTLKKAFDERLNNFEANG